MSTLRFICTALLAVTASTLAPGTALAQRDCRASLLPAELPAVDALVDSAAVAALLATSGIEGVLRFAIVADAGTAPRVFPIAGGAASPASTWLTPRIEASLRPGQRSTTAWGVRLVAAADSITVLALERSEYCRAQARPGGTTTLRVVRRSGSPPPRPAVYSFHVSSSGTVSRVSFLQPSDRDIETQIRRTAMSRRYDPARIDGVPVASVDTIGRP